MQDYESFGRKQLDMYESVIKSKSEDLPIVQTQAELTRYAPNQAFIDARNIPDYKFESTKLMATDVDRSLSSFRSSDVGFSIKGQWVQKITIKNQRGETINEGSYDTNGKFIIYQNAFKSQNDIVKDKIPLNELGLQNFLNTAGPEKSKNFQAAILTNIQNKGFWAITRESYNDLKQPFDKVLTFDRGHPETGKGFERVMGSPNFGSKFFAFTNHHNAIGDKVPYKIVVIPKQAANKNDVAGVGMAVAVVFKDV